MKHQDTPNLHDTRLETLVNEIRKDLEGKPYRLPYLEELARRVELTYIQNIDHKQLTNFGVCRDRTGFNYYGWHDISQLGHVKEYDNTTALFHFNYSEENVWEAFDADKHVQEKFPLQYVCYHQQCGFDVLAHQTCHGWCVGSDNRHAMEAVSIKVDVTKATRFMLFAYNNTSITNEGVLASNRKLRERVTDMQRVLEAKAIELDALAAVWCTGNCEGGQFRFTEPVEINDAMLGAIMVHVQRLIGRGPNTGKLQERIERFRQTVTRKEKHIRDHALEPFVKAAKERINEVRLDTMIVPDVQPITHCAPYITHGAGLKSFSVDDALMYLLDKHVITARPGIDGSVKFFLLVTNLPGYYGTDIEISFKHIQEIYDAYHIKYGLVVWVAELTGKAPSMGTFYVGEMKKLGMWKPEWDVK